MRRRELICSLGALALTKGLGSASSRATVDDQASSTGAAQQMEARIIAGVRLVDSRLAKAANDLARSVSPPYLYNHAVRTFLFASLAGTATGQKFDAEMLYLACILHDLGLTEKFQGVTAVRDSRRRSREALSGGEWLRVQQGRSGLGWNRHARIDDRALQTT